MKAYIRLEKYIEDIYDNGYIEGFEDGKKIRAETLPKN